MKFNKDTFLNDITDKVQSAIDKNLITQEDVDNNDMERLHGFIQYELLEYIEDRKFAIDVLKDFNYDEKATWKDLQEKFGTFKSLLDIALVNLWKFLESEHVTEYSYYVHDNKKTGNMLDLVHDKEEFPSGDEGSTVTDPNNDGVGFEEGGEKGDTIFSRDDENGESGDRPRRRIRIAK